MRKYHPTLKLLVIVVLGLNLQACGSIQQMVQGTPTYTPTNTLTPSPTLTATSTPTLTPTNTPRPTFTPNATATEFAKRSDLMFAEVRQYLDAGYVSSTDGTYIELDNFTQDWAQLGWYKWWPFDVEASVFVMSGHFSWSSAYSETDDGGCGFVFQELNEPPFAVFLERYGVHLWKFGKEITKINGNSSVRYLLPAEADFTLIVGDKERAYVIVDNQFISEYKVPASIKRPFRIGYSVLSGTNMDYGTHCEITNARLWKIK